MTQNFKVRSKDTTMCKVARNFHCCSSTYNVKGYQLSLCIVWATSTSTCMLFFEWIHWCEAYEFKKSTRKFPYLFLKILDQYLTKQLQKSFSSIKWCTWKVLFKNFLRNIFLYLNYQLDTINWCLIFLHGSTVAVLWICLTAAKAKHLDAGLWAPIERKLSRLKNDKGEKWHRHPEGEPMNNLGRYERWRRSCKNKK